MNLDYLRTFHKLVELGSFSQAAKKMSLSQPAVSFQIQKMEQELGTRLIDRGQKKFTLTEAGERLLHFVGTVEGEYEQLLHGEAVAIGMMGAAMISQRQGLLPQEIVERQQLLLQRFCLPTSCPIVDIARLLQAMELDKKMIRRAVRWVLLKGVGEVVIQENVPQEIVTSVIKELLKG